MTGVIYVPFGRFDAIIVFTVGTDPSATPIGGKFAENMRVLVFVSTYALKMPWTPAPDVLTLRMPVE